MKISTVMAVSALLGCAPHAPSEEAAARAYVHQDARILVTEEFERRKDACALAGGTLQMHRSSSGRQRPTIDEMKMATCSRRRGAATVSF